MHRECALNGLRKSLADRGLHAMIIPTNDPHFGEYTQPHYKVREWLSGFTGSAGTLAVTEKSAALWTDSRYFIQAEEQLKGRGRVLIRPSGTEPLLRVMVEADDKALAQTLAQSIADTLS